MIESHAAPRVPARVGPRRARPGGPSLQAAGYYVALAQPTLHVVHASTNVEDIVGRPVQEIVGRAVEDVVGPRAAATLFEHLSQWGALPERNPVQLFVATTAGPQPFDAILHEVRQRDGSRLLAMELERADRLRSYAFPDTNRATRFALEAFNDAGSVDDLLRAACRQVRTMTGFDRVFVRSIDDVEMVVVAEARRDELSPVLGLRVLTRDFPRPNEDGGSASVSALVDTDGSTTTVVPGVDGRGAPIDITAAVLRPVTDEYAALLRATGVRSELAVDIQVDGKPWGQLIGRHYAGLHMPPYAVRAAVELLASTLAQRLAAYRREEEAAANAARAAALARIVATAVDESRALGSALLGRPGLLDVVGATGALVFADEIMYRQGEVPADVTALRDRLLAADQGVLACTSLRAEEPELAATLPGVAGYLAIRGPDRRFLVWLRAPIPTHVWGDDLQTASLPRQGRALEYDTVRGYFQRWAEVMADRCEPWTERDLRAARELRERLFEVLLARAANELRVAEVLQRSLLPAALPDVEGWSVDALYRPAAAGRVGGDWYDVLPLPGGLLALAVGDVGGHGLAASAAMGQLRNGLRAYLVAGDDAATALARLDVLIQWTLPEDMATVVVGVLDPRDGSLTLASAGHPPGVLVEAGGGAALVSGPVDRPLGLGTGSPPATHHVIAPGAGLVLYSDGLVETRDVPLTAGLERLRLACEGAARAGVLSADEVLRRCVDSIGPDEVADDVTLLVLRRDSGARDPDASGAARA